MKLLMWVGGGGEEERSTRIGPTLSSKGPNYVFMKGKWAQTKHFSPKVKRIGSEKTCLKTSHHLEFR